MDHVQISGKQKIAVLSITNAHNPPRKYSTLQMLQRYCGQHHANELLSTPKENRRINSITRLENDGIDSHSVRANRRTFGAITLITSPKHNAPHHQRAGRVKSNCLVLHPSPLHDIHQPPILRPTAVLHETQNSAEYKPSVPTSNANTTMQRLRHRLQISPPQCRRNTEA